MRVWWFRLFGCLLFPFDCVFVVCVVLLVCSLLFVCVCLACFYNGDIINYKMMLMCVSCWLCVCSLCVVLVFVFV